MQLRKELREDIEAQKEEQLAAAKEEFDEETQQIRSLLDIAHKQKVRAIFFFKCAVHHSNNNLNDNYNYLSNHNS